MKLIVTLLCFVLVATTSATTNKETVLTKLQHSIENRIKLLKLLRGVDANGNFKSSVTDKSHTGYDHDAVKKQVSTIDFVDFSVTRNC